MTRNVKIGYNPFMLVDFLACMLRLCLLVVVWMLVWRLVRPTNQLARIIRAATLVLALLVVFALLRLGTG